MMEEEPWKQHLRECPECLSEWKSLAGSLALFHQIESERVSRCESVLCWDKFSALLAQEKNRFGSLRLLLVASVAGLLLTGGFASWLFLAGPAAPRADLAEEPGQAPSEMMQAARPLEEDEAWAVLQRLASDEPVRLKAVGLRSLNLEIRFDNGVSDRLEISPHLMSPTSPGDGSIPRLFLNPSPYPNNRPPHPRTMPVSNRPAGAYPAAR